jgi:predicted phage terminase large subunit-like protein
MHPTMQKGWFQCEVANAFQQFYDDLKAGKRPKMILMSPPQHGKSRQTTDFMAWLAGLDPSLKMIYASFSDRLGIRANLWLQRMMDGQAYRGVFGARINPDNVVTRSGKPLRNREILEFVKDDQPADGYFRNTTVMGSITGEGLDIGIIDDPMKGRAEASSETIRDKTWDWLTDDFMTRFSDLAGMIMILTRWHMDDPAGRLQETFPDARILRFEAIATEDEKYRLKGQPLFPELKSLDFLNQQKKGMTQAGWESVYQQNPIIVGGGLFPIEKFGVPLLIRPDRKETRKSVRYWDKAGTADGGAFTAGVLMHEMRDGRFVISDVIRGQWGAFDREVIIKQTCVADNAEWNNVDTWVEQEPGSGGKESAERTVVNLAGFNVYKDKVRGNKELRADPYAAQVQAGNVRLVASTGGKWIRDFLDEHEAFPSGKYKDQVDAAGGAFVKLTNRIFDVPMETGLPIFGKGTA